MTFHQAAVQCKAGLRPWPRQELALTLALYRQQDAMARCTLQAKVVTVAEDQFTVAFLDVSEEQKAALFQCLVHEVRQDMA